jgi:hypothetical protein
MKDVRFIKLRSEEGFLLGFSSQNDFFSQKTTLPYSEQKLGESFPSQCQNEQLRATLFVKPASRTTFFFVMRGAPC